MFYVWVVTFSEDDSPAVFSSAEKAYNYMNNFILEEMTYRGYDEDEINDTLNDLTEDYAITDDAFGAQWLDRWIFCAKAVIDQYA